MAQTSKARKLIGLVPKKDRNGNVHWYARIVRTMPDGSKKQYTRKGDDKTHAKRLLRDLEDRYSHSRHEGVQGERLTVRDLASIYEERHLIPAQFAGTDGRKVSGLKNTVEPKRFLRTIVEYLGNIRLRDLTHSDIEHFKTQRLKKPVIHEKKLRIKDPATGAVNVKVIRTERQRSIASVNRELEQIRAALRYAVRQGWLVRSPFDAGRPVISKAAEHRRERTLSYDEESRLLIACASKPAHLRPLVICALDTAMRKSEMLKLRWTEVDFAASVINVKASNSKTERARTVPMTPRLRVELEALYAKADGKTNDLVYSVRDNVKRSFASACMAAKIEGFRLHDCRHTAITRMIAAGVPAEETMKISGHSQITTFLRYLNPTHASLNKAAERLWEFNLRSQAAIETSEAVN